MSQDEALSPFARYTRRERRWTTFHSFNMRLTESQWAQLTRLTQNIELNKRRARAVDHDIPFERVTNNTLIRIAVELLFVFSDALSGNSEAELVENVKAAARSLRGFTSPPPTSQKKRVSVQWTAGPQIAGRVTEDQWNRVTELRQRLALASSRARAIDPDIPFERVTNNTLIRIGVELLFVFSDALTGNSEAELAANTRALVNALAAAKDNDTADVDRDARQP